jgi:hypothetical protein
MPYREAPPAPLDRIAFVLGVGRRPVQPSRSAVARRGELAAAPLALRALTASAASATSGASVARERLGGLRDEGLDACAEEVVAEIEGLERSKARLEARLIDAYAALHSVQEQQLAMLPRSPVPLSADQVVTQEIACATGVGAAEVSRRLELAVAPRRHRVLRERLRAGRVSLYRALQVVAETRALDDHLVPDLENAVLAPAPDGSVSSQRLFMSRLRRCVRAADRRAEPERRCAAGRRRTVFGRLTDDGMGVFTVVATAQRVVAVLDRADALARSARAAGDERTLDQLRSDFLCDLALFGVVPAPSAAPRESSGRVATPPGLAPTCGSWLAAPPPATVRIVVPFEVAAGVSDAACEIPGHGWVTAAHARQIMTAPGSVWQRLAVEVDTGRALELSTDRYTPTPQMVEHVRAVDGVCRAPGCQVPAERCDLDHLVPWPRGETRVSNFESLSRGCHNRKTAGAWNAERVGDEGVRWTSLAGREYVTYPKDWREALRDPGSGPASSEVRRPPGRASSDLAGGSLDPPPF